MSVHQGAEASLADVENEISLKLLASECWTIFVQCTNTVSECGFNCKQLSEVLGIKLQSSARTSVLTHPAQPSLHPRCGE